MQHVQRTRQATLDSLTGSLHRSGSTTLIPPMEEEYEDVTSDMEDTLSHFTNALDTAIDMITKELKKIKSDFGKAISEHKKLTEAVKAENAVLKEKCQSLEARIDDLEKSRDEQAILHNKRFSRRNNIRIV
ncbi:hypothetical protein HOLleu_09263 [Holothuria leucospilota]|uniref:Uncharacterized protein n=1 Tax=Holothuria leucospilota TaxID=206669 RepID=A0A9Q1CJV9_HOLLE|nr:hypothetical protein HOLleu_09263 [Holothuria leucospilota]